MQILSNIVTNIEKPFVRSFLLWLSILLVEIMITIQVENAHLYVTKILHSQALLLSFKMVNCEGSCEWFLHTMSSFTPW
jgi:hypothetical protein